MRVIEVPKRRLLAVWMNIAPGLKEYRRKYPQLVPPDWELFQWLQSPEGDELVVFSVKGKYGGFLTYNIYELGDDLCGIVSIIHLTKGAQEVKALPELSRMTEIILRQRGCSVMSYFTYRDGFRKLAPQLGFRQGITEWRKEL